MAVGDGYTGHKKVEEGRNGVWQTLDDFPFVNDNICCYSMVNFNEDLYLFGTFLFNQKLVNLNLLFILINNIFKGELDQGGSSTRPG